jgi:hypothetical protein
LCHTCNYRGPGVSKSFFRIQLEAEVKVERRSGPFLNLDLNFQRADGLFQQPARRELPDSEGTAIEMDELRAWIIPYPTVLQLQRGLANLARLDTGNIEVERLPLNM